MQSQARRIVTGHDAQGNSVILSDGTPPQDHAMTRAAIGADFVELWNSPDPVPALTSEPASEPSLRPFTIMPTSGHLIRQIVLYPASQGGERTVMHRTRTLDYAVVIEGEVTLHMTDSSVTLGPGSVVVQNGTDHAWENQSDAPTRMVFFHIDAEFSDELRAKLPEELNLMR
jgi:mannose-6-phosphate isomerase-like protein (cupin superfamily)